ncbi:4-hydroxybenzoate 3-monooxygenase [Ralstonia nicotianae]|uniref:4-hydroxybenzoate 3-monooxygenase n=2 Tax=Ralstonia solanacearum species complex TaxID=3116862 RepID=A0A0S4U471_RALSL|nr:4-hydroxybenzoate 3-monooxygenase [Ralstonia pseudosolanacearum]AUS42886.1 4-hydroxybenzoate 3-monooxygenase [Ralstonia solanacearum]ASL74410.1 4-hydroxybenzoate 3-monooxygenase [Ralstonia pseudosolanacearum]AST85954.1 4-hydroxybenzoate 3-monooxygenase [Ralstonia pseudosolanacearum]AYA46046.1 4-hydroxybenzoate 3-monooxygenase [Ralstonia pseudosolanacearum]KAF3462356.1 4-hydroxybenzoate 3-monooxygenase [Ralstonia solanacearum]
MRTQVAIIGAGPAGLLLGQLLQRSGIDAVILETRSRQYVEERIRAGVLEQGTVDTLNEAGVGERMRREGLVHHGIDLLFEGKRHRLELTALSGGRSITVYGQHEVVKDLIAARIGQGAPLLFEVSEVSLHDLESATPSVRFVHEGVPQTLHCDYIAGCDGFHGICRPAIPAQRQAVFERVYPFAWLGILAEAAPAADELIYASHARGFALFSMRSPKITRLYLQCKPDENLAEWSDARIWDELHTRLENNDGWHLKEGPILQKSVTPMRSFVCETMRHGRLFLAGDAAHIVPPTGAKGMNLAVADVRVLAQALTARYRQNDTAQLDGYAERCLQRIWRAEHFSWWMTSMLHRFDDHTPFMQRLQRAELEYLTTSPAAARTLAENYVGLPFADAPARALNTVGNVSSSRAA